MPTIEVTPVDGAILAVMLIAVARGIFIGLIREVFSIAALGAACVAVRFATGPAAAWLQGITSGQFGPSTARWIAAALLAIASVVAVGFAGRALKRGASAAGLGWADRIGGAAVGAAEATLLISLVLVAAGWAVGPDHPMLAESRGVEAFEQLQEFVLERSVALPDVAAPPR
jgi:membrane protein required for colicin V production